MKTRRTPRQQPSVTCRMIGVAGGKRCVPAAGGLRNEPRADLNHLAAEVREKKQVTIIKGATNAAKKKEEDSFAARLARLRKELARPQLTKSVREKATQQQIASWNAG